jgi:hypothetical protein
MICGLLGVANDSSFLEVDYAATRVGLWRYLVRLQSKPPPGHASVTFSGDTKRTIYFAQFLWDVLKLSEDDLSSCSPPAVQLNPELGVSGLIREAGFRADQEPQALITSGKWTDTIIQLGPLGSEIRAA